ncbi:MULTISPECIES: DUF896 domain-containing protein [Vitreoscilla]|uniref:DUF896 domain-containing protein n=1 Tax=Vitreoscilla stercoraria TaxID=61 RepID=A0ABY4E9P4_VITST|nr:MULTISPECIES: DUF896 domain-containing protein [Vitreoscilla]AUZ06150.1 hypothetical protein ADP71_29290 [Vitreoscilla sp. C1]UOO92485.1 DUF896 domain-containing protein [Vitreoscilla stercoraria]
MRIIELDRINTLARKARAEGLSAAELAERDALRQTYLRQVRGQMTNTLANVTVLDPEGTDVTPLKLRAHQWAGTMQVN